MIDDMAVRLIVNNVIRMVSINHNTFCTEYELILSTTKV